MALSSHDGDSAATGCCARRGHGSHLAANDLRKAEHRRARDLVARAGNRGRAKGSLRRAAGRLALYALCLVVAVPLVLIGLYRSPSIHPVSTLMVSDLVLGNDYQRVWVDYDDIAPALVQSVMVSEDNLFCFHGGVDWSALNLVIEEALDGERTRGASTIPMQTAKNLFLWNSRSYLRKALEIPLAMIIDAAWPKRRLMEIYLNIAEWGPGLYGIEAAAQHYYGIPAAQLSRRRAAYLAVVLPDPTGRDPARPSAGVTRLARAIEERARQSGAYIKCLDA